jgi:hypothetical protein
VQLNQPKNKTINLHDMPEILNATTQVLKAEYAIDAAIRANGIGHPDNREARDKLTAAERRQHLLLNAAEDAGHY